MTSLFNLRFRQRTFLHCSSGFTIIELLISVFILGVLSSIVIPSTLVWRRNQVISGFAQSLFSEINLVSEESKRFGATCNIQFNSYMNGDFPFQVDCRAAGRLVSLSKCRIGSSCNISQISSMLSVYPTSSDNNNLLYINSNVRSFAFTPRGQLGGLSDIAITVSGSGYLGPPSITRCIIVRRLTGEIEHGVYSGSTRALGLNQSTYNPSITSSRCST